MSVNYDPAVINFAAKKLYTKANKTIKQGMLVYGMMFFVCGTALGGWVAQLTHLGLGILFCFSFLFLIIGLFIGKEVSLRKAMQLRLQAQSALCQVEIEKNLKELHMKSDQSSQI